MASPCTSPPEVTNGYVSYSSLSLSGNGGWVDGTAITYDCSKYYSFVDSDTLSCSNGTWTGTFPKCEYSQSTETVFGILVALFVLLLILLLTVLIFLCCYFCSCCKRFSRKRDECDDPEIGGRRRTGSTKSFKDPHDNLNGHAGEGSSSNRSSNYHDDHKNNPFSQSFVTGSNETTKEDRALISRDDEDKVSPTPKPFVYRVEIPTDEIRVQPVIAPSRPPVFAGSRSPRKTDHYPQGNRQREDDDVIEDDDYTEKKSGCCRTTEARSDPRRRQRKTDEGEGVKTGCCGGKCCVTTEVRSSPTRHDKTSDDGEVVRTGCCKGRCCVTTESRDKQRERRHQERDSDEDSNESSEETKSGCCAGCCKTTEGKSKRKRGRQNKVGSDDRLQSDRRQYHQQQPERHAVVYHDRTSTKRKAEPQRNHRGSPEPSQQARERTNEAKDDSNKGSDSETDDGKKGCCASCCTTTKGKTRKRSAHHQPSEHRERAHAYDNKQPESHARVYTNQRTEPQRTHRRSPEPRQQQAREINEDRGESSNKSDSDTDDGKKGCCAGCCTTTEGKRRKRRAHNRPTEQRDRAKTDNSAQPESYAMAYRDRTRQPTKQTNQQNRENANEDKEDSQGSGHDSDDDKKGCCAGCCRTTKGKQRKRKREHTPPTDNRDRTQVEDPKKQENQTKQYREKTPTQQKAYVAKGGPLPSRANDDDRLVEEEYKRQKQIEEKEREMKRREKEREEALRREEERRRKEEEEREEALKRERERRRKEEEERRLQDEKDRERNRLEDEKRRDQERRERELQQLDKELEDEKQAEEEREKEFEEEKNEERYDDEMQRRREEEMREDILDRKEKQEAYERERKEKEARRRRLQDRKREREEQHRRELIEIYGDKRDHYADKYPYDGADESALESSGYGSPSQSPKRKRKLRDYNEVLPRYLQYSKKVEKKKAEPKPLWRYW